MSIQITTCISISLLHITLLYAQDVIISPSDQLVAPLGGSARFICSSSLDMIQNIRWLINGTVAINFPPSQVIFEFSTEFRIGILTFDNLTFDYNMSRIQCIASFDSQVISSEVTVLLVQGPLPAVGNLMVTVANSTAFLSWIPPFSLELLHEEPIGYCVDIHRSNLLVHSECDIEKTRYSYPLPPDSACHIYSLSVTPISLLGSGQVDLIALIKQLGVPTKPVLEAQDDNLYVISMSAGVCNAILTFEDLDTGEIITLGDGELTIRENTITFTTEQLTDNRHCNVSVNAFNVAGSFTSYTTLSTHDILNATTTETDDDAIVITTLYSEHSDARGALFDFVFIDDNGDVDWYRSVLLALDRNISLNHTLPQPFNLYPGQYKVFIYDIERSGKLSNGVGYPAVMNELLANEGSLSQPQFTTPTCVITTSFVNIMAQCASDTMATGFQMIAQLSDEVHKLYINQSMDLQTPVTVEVEESGVYLITIIPITKEAGIVGSGVEYVGEVMVETTPTSYLTTVENTSSGIGVGDIIGVVGAVVGVVTVGMLTVLVFILVLNTKFRGQKQEKYCRTKMDEKLRQNSVTTTEKFLPKLEAEDVDVLVKGIHVHIQKQQKEIRMKIGRVLGLSEKNTLKELLNDWVMKSEGATLNELTHALDQVGLGNELSINMPQDIQAKDVDFLAEKIDSHPWKKIGVALQSPEKKLDQKNREQYLREILNVWLESSKHPTLEGLNRVLGFEAIDKSLLSSPQLQTIGWETETDL